MKKILPQPVKKILIAVKQKTYDQWQKKRLFNRMQLKHAELLKEVKGKERIKIVFLAMHKSVWKVDPIFHKMLKDSFFEPEILVCPYISYGEERMLEDMDQAYNYFIEKGYPVRKAMNEDGSWLTLGEIKPDIVFFTNPHDLTRKEYYQDAYVKYLSCYVPYHHEVGSYGNNIAQYNQKIHNALWCIFASHKASLKLFKITSAAKASNVIVTGYPAMEELINKKIGKNYNNVWKTSDGRVRVIWAPHHTIDDQTLPYSNFIEYAENFKSLALKYKDKVVWAFKPHPILKSKLYLHPDWGKEKTDEFYFFWSDQVFSQLETGEYFDLFLSSDLMIHDSGSFLAEYLYVNKPVMYLLNKANQKKHYTEFGINALNSCEIGHCFSDIEDFIDKNIEGKIELKQIHSNFIKYEIAPFFVESKPSDKIINFLKGKLV